MNIALSKLTTRVLAGLAERVVNSSKNGNYKMAEEHDLLKALERESSEYRKLYGKLSFSGKGPEIVAADAARDKAFVALRFFLKGYKDLPLPNAADAAVLYKVFEQYGANLERMNYAAETAQLNVVFDEFDKAENAARFETLKIKLAYEDLKAKQKAFEDLYATQAEANAALRALPSASTARVRLEAALHAYLGLLDVMKTLPVWDMLYHDINEMVKAAVATYKNDKTPSEPKNPKGPKDPKDPQKPSDPKKPDEPKKPKDPKDPKDPKNPSDPKKPDEKPKDPKDPKNPDEKPKKPKPGDDDDDIHLPEE